MSETLTADEVIAQLGLKPHPEGGWFRETFRDETGPHGRAHSTAILFLLKAGEVSRWHKVDAAELWHWHGGAPLLLEVKDAERRHEYRLGLPGTKAITRTRRCRRMPGRAPAASAPGLWWDALSHRGSISRVSHWPPRTGSPSLA